MAIFKLSICFQILSALLFSLPETSFASEETNNLPYACQQELSNYSDKSLEVLILKAEKSVSDLPELKNLSSSVLQDQDDASLKKKIVYSSILVEEYLLSKIGCFSEISVFIDDSEKKHLWNTFLVNMKGVPEAIKNSDGNFIALDQWRVEIKSHETNCLH